MQVFEQWELAIRGDRRLYPTVLKLAPNVRKMTIRAVGASTTSTG
jgi:hypothetical protein